MARTTLSIIDEDVLIALSRYHYLTVKQVMRYLGYPDTSYTYVASTRLKRLVDNGYLLKRGGKIGQGAGVFCLADAGYKYLRHLEVETRKPRRPYREMSLGAGTLSHTLAVNDCLIAAELLPKHAPSVRYIRQLHEAHFKEQPFVISMNGREQKLMPDGWFEVHRRWPEETQQLCFALEVQHRGHFDRAVIRKKTAAYLQLAKSGVYSRYFQDEELPLIVLFVASRGMDEAMNIRKAIETELKASGDKDYELMFFVAPMPEDVGRLYSLPIWARPFRQGVYPLFFDG